MPVTGAADLGEMHRKTTQMTTPQSHTPNDMPGANPNPQLQHPIDTAPPPAAAPQQQSTPPPDPTPPTPPPPAQSEPPATGTVPGSAVPAENWRDIARKMEARAKENEEKAKKYDEAQTAKMTQDERDRAARLADAERIKNLEAEVARERVARETGVLPELLAGQTYEEMTARAQQLLEWRSAGQPQTPPPPPTAAVPASTVTSADTMNASPNGVQQLTREQFVALPPAERMAAVRAGQCTSLGIGQPKTQRRMGNSIELGAVAGAPAPAGGVPVVRQ